MEQVKQIKEYGIIDYSGIFLSYFDKNDSHYSHSIPNHALLATNKYFFPMLFDFTSPWKIDILDFLNENYMYELSLEEIASYTGRSLSTFKREFAQISNITPQKWIMNKRLQAAYEKLQDKNNKASDIYLEVGFKNLSHFYTAFKKQFGYTPGK